MMFAIFALFFLALHEAQGRLNDPLSNATHDAIVVPRLDGNGFVWITSSLDASTDIEIDDIGGKSF
jgi:hypothetical protein